jgi:phosphoglycerate dehydrogenase-like enzyme
MAATILFCTDTFWDAWGEEVVTIDPTVEVIRLVGDHQVTEGDLARITTAFFSPDCWPLRAKPFIGACLRAPNLTWLQSMSAGTDDPVFARFLDRGVAVTNAAGVAAPSIAQHVLWLLLSLARGGRRLAQAQAEKVWDPRPSTDLAGLRLGIVGYGAIGAEIAKLAAAFDVEVVGLRRHPSGAEACTVWTSDRLGDLLGWADAVVVTAPLTDETRRMIDADALSAMRRGAWLINVGRGEIVDEPALIGALADDHLGGAALDVFSTEPLPVESALWTLPNVIVTPHTAASTERTRRRTVELFLDNFRRHAAGEPLRNLVSISG